MSNVSGGTITVKIQGQDIGLSDLLARINQQMVASGQSAKTYASQMAQISPIAQKTDQALARYAQSLAAVAKAQGDTLGSQKILAQGLQQITPATTSANQVLAQLQTSLNQTNNAAQTASNNYRSIGASLGTLVGGYFVATRVISAFGAVVNQGNELEKTLTTFRVLSGSQEQYAKNLQLAREQQDRFGGSLQDTVEGMSSFANLSSRTGIEINKLTNLARAMATIDPAQGFKGAGIALKEFFSGEITSLARRFEIPREALSGVEKITDQKEKFEALQAVLAQFGISQELVTEQANTTAVTYDKLAGSIDDAKASIGQFIAQAAAPAAQTLTKWAEQAAVGFDTLRTKSESMQNISAKIFGSTSNLDEFNAKIAATNNVLSQQIGPLASIFFHIQPLTEAQYRLAQSLIATGSSADQAFTALNENAQALDVIRSNIASASSWYGIGAQTAQDFALALSQTAITSQEAAGFAQGLAQAVANGLPVEQAMIALQQFKANQLAVTAAAEAAATQETQNALTATELFTQALTAEALEKANSQIAGDALKLTQEQLYNAALAAAQGMGATASSAAALAGQFSITTGEAYNLISALSQLEVAKAKQALGVTPGGANEREDRLGTNQDIIQRAKDAELQKKLADIRRANALAAADTAGKLQLERDALARLNKGSVEYETQLGKVQAAERALQAEKDRNAKKGGGAPKLTPNEKINTKLLDDQDKFNDKFEDAEQKHWDKVADIYAKFNEEQQKQFAKNEVSKRRSRADFYAGLQDAPAGVDTQKFAAQYEEAFAKAQEIAQTGKAKLANEFLELRQRQIEEMKQLDEEAAKINTQQKEGKISKKDADAQLAYLAGRKKLIEDAQAEEQKQLLEGGDENINRLNEQLSQEEQAYNANVDKISTAAERKADAVITHAARSKIAVSEENKLLADQEAHYRRIAQLNGGQVPASQRGSPIPTSSGGTQGEAGKPVDVAASSPIPVTSSDALLVRQAEFFVVSDPDVMSSIGDMATRVEGKLSEVVAAISNAKDAISSAVNAVESAVGRIRINSPSVVGN